jgi:GNAT superfamily N-acetyltransferase
VTAVPHIRDGQPAEVGALEALQRRASLVYESDRPHLEAHPEAIELPADVVRDSQVRVATSSGALIGFSVLLPVGEGVFDLDGLFVDPAHWGQGIGRALVADVVRQARQRGAARIEVVANPNALDFYQKMGFVGGAEVPTRFGPGIAMWLTL